MEGKKQERYSLMGPGGGISAVSMEAGEFHLFGNSCTTIITTETDNYPVIEDEPGKLEVVDNTDLMSGIGHGIANGLLLCAGVVLFAGATAATGGVALLLGGCVLGGASFGVSAATDGMVESDRETGNDRSWGDFALGLAGGGVTGATTGAVLYGTVMAAPVAGLAAGMDAAAVIGPSAFTTTVVPAIITGGGYGLAGATALYVENDIRARNGGYNLLLDKVFENNTDRYEECGMILMLGNNVYMEYGAMNMNCMPGGDSKESLGNNQSVQKLKDQNSSSGTGGGNAGSGGGASSSGTGGQTKTGVKFRQKSFKDIMSPEEAQRYDDYWKQGAGSYKNIVENGDKKEIIINKGNILNTRQRLQTRSGIRSIVDIKYGENGQMYYRETIFDSFGRRIGNNNFTDYGTPHIHSNPHYHSNSPLDPQAHGSGVPGLHPSTP